MTRVIGPLNKIACCCGYGRWSQLWSCQHPGLDEAQVRLEIRVHVMSRTTIMRTLSGLSCREGKRNEEVSRERRLTMRHQDLPQKWYEARFAWLSYSVWTEPLIVERRKGDNVNKLTVELKELRNTLQEMVKLNSFRVVATLLHRVR